MNKIIGIIGGAGPFASALLYQKIIEKAYQERPEAPHIAIVIINYPFNTPMFADPKKVNAALQWCIDRFIANGVSAAAIACNTLHCYLAAVDHKGITFISLPKITEKYAKQKNCQKLLLLCTNATIKGNLYCDPNIQYFYLSAEKQCLLIEIIERILMGKILENDADKVTNMVREVAITDDIDGVILGCTELSVLHNRYPLCDFNSSLIIDSTDLLAHEICVRF